MEVFTVCIMLKGLINGSIEAVIRALLRKKIFGAMEAEAINRGNMQESKPLKH